MQPAPSKEISRLFVLMLTLAGFCLLPPEALDLGPRLCLWRKLFHLAGCPACGSTQALAAFFHGQLARALAFNRNVVITAPGFLASLACEILGWLRRVRASGLRSSRGLNTVAKAE